MGQARDPVPLGPACLLENRLDPEAQGVTPKALGGAWGARAADTPLWPHWGSGWARLPPTEERAGNMSAERPHTHVHSRVTDSRVTDSRTREQPGPRTEGRTEERRTNTRLPQPDTV